MSARRVRWLPGRALVQVRQLYSWPSDTVKLGFEYTAVFVKQTSALLAEGLWETVHAASDR